MKKETSIKEIGLLMGFLGILVYLSIFLRIQGPSIFETEGVVMDPLFIILVTILVANYILVMVTLFLKIKRIKEEAEVENVK